MSWKGKKHGKFAGEPVVGKGTGAHIGYRTAKWVRIPVEEGSIELFFASQEQVTAFVTAVIEGAVTDPKKQQTARDLLTGLDFREYSHRWYAINELLRLRLTDIGRQP